MLRSWLGQMIRVRIEVCCAFGLALVFYSSIQRVGDLGGTRVVTSYTSVVLGYAGSFGYDRTPQCDWGRRQVVTALSVRRNSGVEFSVLPDVRVQCRRSCKEVTGLDVLRCGTFSPLSHFPGTYSPNHVLT